MKVQEIFQIYWLTDWLANREEIQISKYITRKRKLILLKKEAISKSG